MQSEKSVAEMAEEVLLCRQARARARRTGQSLAAARAAVIQPQQVGNLKN